MQFDSFAAFFEMGGYGFFVWLSYAAAFVLLTLLVGLSLLNFKQTKANLAKKYNRDARIKASIKQQRSEVPNESTP